MHKPCGQLVDSHVDGGRNGPKILRFARSARFLGRSGKARESKDLDGTRRVAVTVRTPRRRVGAGLPTRAGACVYLTGPVAATGDGVRGGAGATGSRPPPKARPGLVARPFLAF